MLIYFPASILLQNSTLPTSKPNLPLVSWVNTSLQPGLLLCSAVSTSPPRVTRFTLFCCLQSQEVSVLSSAGSVPSSSAHIGLVCLNLLVVCPNHLAISHSEQKLVYCCGGTYICYSTLSSYILFPKPKWKLIQELCLPEKAVQFIRSFPRLWCRKKA